MPLNHVVHQCTDPTSALIRSYATRFLIKFLDTPAHSLGYSWLYLSFSILWAKKNDELSCVLVCYDDSNDIKFRAKIVEWLTNYPLDNIMQNPLAIHDAVLRAIVVSYDEALWLFRVPVREIEKVGDFLRRIPTRDL